MQKIKKYFIFLISTLIGFSLPLFSISAQEEASAPSNEAQVQTSDGNPTTNAEGSDSENQQDDEKVDSVWGAFKYVGRKTKSGSITAGQAIKEGSIKVGHEIKEGSITAGHEIKKGAKATGRAFKKAGHEIKNFFVGDDDKKDDDK